MRSERKLMVERIENLETIVCGVDLELNQKLNKLIDEHRLITTGAGGVPANPASPGGALAAAKEEPAGHGRTMGHPAAAAAGVAAGPGARRRAREPLPLLGGPKTATDVRYDFLALLLDELNRGETRYRAVVL